MTKSPYLVILKIDMLTNSLQLLIFYMFGVCSDYDMKIRWAQTTVQYAMVAGGGVQEEMTEEQIPVHSSELKEW